MGGADPIDEKILANSDYLPSTKYESCKYCLTQYELINLYVENKISADELRRIPSFQSEEIIEHIDEIKNKLVERGIIKDT